MRINMKSVMEIRLQLYYLRRQTVCQEYNVPTSQLSYIRLDFSWLGEVQPDWACPDR
jgi:hypothetical protein